MFIVACNCSEMILKINVKVNEKDFLEMIFLQLITRPNRRKLVLNLFPDEPLIL